MLYLLYKNKYHIYDNCSKRSFLFKAGNCRELEYTLESSEKLLPIYFIYSQIFESIQYYVFTKANKGKTKNGFMPINLKQLLIYPKPPKIFSNAIKYVLRHSYISIN